MSQQNHVSTYLGFWIDWSEGRFQGATWTLSHRDGALLGSFTAIFTTFVFAQLWSIVAFVLHHIRSTRKPEDGLKHQQQAVLRNAGALVSAVFFARQTKSWHGKAEQAKIRSIKWACVALLFAAAAGLASTFSGYAASKSSLNRLVISDNCGYTTYTDGTGQVNFWAFTTGMTKDTVAAADYARACYDNGKSNREQCKRYIRPRLNWTGSYDTPCPFQSGICSNGDQASFTLLSEKIDSLTGLGINSPPSDRLSLQKRMTCSSIREVRNYYQVGNLVYYTFGPIGGLDFTYVYNRLARDAFVPYSLTSTYSYASVPSTWSPIQALNRTDADVSIIFIGMNSVNYVHPNDDPIFSATTKNRSLDGTYTADYDVSTLACAEQYQVCNPAVQSSSNNGSGCTPWMGAAQFAYQTDYLNSTAGHSPPIRGFPSVRFLEKSEARLSARQLAILQRITLVLPWTSTYNAIAYRRASALRLQDTLVNLRQIQPLSDRYWTSEVGWWFDACLARLQEGIIDFAIGPTNADVNNNTTLLSDDETKKLCKNQLTRDTGEGTINFSVLALSIIYVVGLVIIVLSLFVDTVSKFFYTRFWPAKSFKTTVWEEDGFMHLHRAAFAAVGADTNGDSDQDHQDVTWTSDSIPVTTRREKMVHFSITSPTAYSTLSTELQAMGGEDRGHKNVTRAAVVDT